MVNVVDGGKQLYTHGIIYHKKTGCGSKANPRKWREMKWIQISPFAPTNNQQPQTCNNNTHQPNRPQTSAPRTTAPTAAALTTYQPEIRAIEMNTSNATATTNPSGSGLPVMRGVEYRCGDCGARNMIKGGDPVRCRQCGFRILYKTRTKRCESTIRSIFCFEYT